MRAVVPLLALAQSVTLVEVGVVTGSPSEEAAAYLSRHGIHPRIMRTGLTQGTVARTLLEICSDQRASYCVMGAYGHSRVRETLFGGVTRRMLADSPLPLVLGR